MQKKSKKPLVIGALAVLLVAFAVGGTIAWLTASSSIANSFTVGEITDPTTPPDGKPNPDTNPDDEYHLEGNIYEVFEQDSTIAPGLAIEKIPYVGIGAGSEDAYVYVYVKNEALTTGVTETARAPYFTLNDGWAPVEGNVTASTAESAASNSYVSGLFVYCGTGNSGSPVALTSNDNADVYTGSVFSSVIVPDATEGDDFAETPKITVGCYIYAATNADSDEMNSAAIAWGNHASGGPTFE